MNLTQQELAELLGCSRPTVERWEKEETCSRGLIVLLMKLLDRNMDYIKELEIPPQKAADSDVVYVQRKILYPN